MERKKWYGSNQKAEEGVLTKERQALVCEDALYKAVQSLDVERYLLFEGGKANVGKKTVSSLFETVIAAIYLDGGYIPAKEFILKFGVQTQSGCSANPKGALQEYLQKRGEALPLYHNTKTGKDNQPIFFCEVQAMGQTATAQGSSKRQSEADAATALLNKLVQKHGK